MTNKVISPLRQRMIDEMTMRRMSPKTQQGYIRAVKRFADFFGRSPDKATAEDIRRFHVHLAKTMGRIPTMNATMTALKFFFGVTLGRRDVVEAIPFCPRAAEAASGFEPRGSCAPAGGGGEHQIPHGLEPCLRHGSARLRSRLAEGDRH